VHATVAVGTANLVPGDDREAGRPPGAPVCDQELDAATRRLYVEALAALRRGGVDFLIGGAYALASYTGIVRDTKDLDVFLRKRDCETALAVLAAQGFATELTFPHWLAKARAGDDYIDLIFGAGNGVALVDDRWFTHAAPGRVFGVPVWLCPPEEMIWSKAFIMERERYDGADVAHLILARGRDLDWRRLLGRFGHRWRVLLSHLVLFEFIYPGERACVPRAVMDSLLRRLDRERAWPGDNARVCHGTLLSRQQYLVDVTRGEYEDGRLTPRGEMSAAEIADWTAAISSSPLPAPPDPTLPPIRRGRRPVARARRRRR
jgi:hypothetical protein